MAQWESSGYKISDDLYTTPLFYVGHKQALVTLFGGSSWDGSGTGEGETPIGGEHSYIF